MLNEKQLIDKYGDIIKEEINVKEVHRLLGDSKAADEAARQMINLLKH